MLGSLRSILSATRSSSRIDVRTLYSVSSLGVDGYASVREKVAMQFHDVKDKFKAKMLDFSKPDNPNMIFTEDLKHMVHLIEKNDADLQLVEGMMLKFAKQNRELRFGSFIFGPVVMRMYHYLNKPEEALKVFKNPEMEGFFDQLITFQVLMDLLYKNEMYKDTIEVFEIIKAKQVQGARHPKNCVVLCFAACYKQNTEESFNYAKQLWSDLTQVGHYPMRRAATFAASLALNHKAPHIALEILTSIKQQTYVTIRNLKVAALADLGRPDDVLPILRSVLEVDEPMARRQTFCADIFERIRGSIQKSGNKEITQEFERIEKELKSLNCITNTTIDDLMCSEITIAPRIATERRVMNSSMRGRYQTNRRPGLEDMI